MIVLFSSIQPWTNTNTIIDNSEKKLADFLVLCGDFFYYVLGQLCSYLLL